MPYYQDATPYKGNIPLTRFYVAPIYRILKFKQRRCSRAVMTWRNSRKWQSSRLSYDYWAEKMQQSEKRKILLIFKEYLEKNISVLRNCAEKPKNIFRNFYREVRLLRTIKFFWMNNKNALTMVSVSPAWRLDREMRRRLILQETWFTR